MVLSTEVVNNEPHGFGNRRLLSTLWQYVLCWWTASDHRLFCRQKHLRRHGIPQSTFRMFKLTVLPSTSVPLNISVWTWLSANISVTIHSVMSVQYTDGKLSAIALYQYLHCVSEKRSTFDLLSSLHTRFDCDNFWQKCCRETRQSKCTSFSHLI